MPSAPHHRFVRSGLSPAETDEVGHVDHLAAQLAAHLTDSAPEIALVHVHRAQSKVVQDIVSRLLRVEIGFGEEVVLSPQEGFTTRARPDFYFELEPGRGVLAEVERGGTTTNNHDLKDLWKTHIAHNAQHLFLVVPVANWNEAGQPRERPFNRVVSRLGAFFGDPRREVDVVSLHVFGYGADVLGG
ncbi:hypothetical protein [Nocardioides litoris]|uniref:hypothetical protein n=1 Tax=Nocardioides litoris TaxID=1926648 RepID=UPI00111D7DC2|nr:hypothetical protein [Nocardioides litoris]